MSCLKSVTIVPVPKKEHQVGLCWTALHRFWAPHLTKSSIKKKQLVTKVQDLRLSQSICHRLSDWLLREGETPRILASSHPLKTWMHPHTAKQHCHRFADGTTGVELFSREESDMRKQRKSLWCKDIWSYIHQKQKPLLWNFLRTSHLRWRCCQAVNSRVYTWMWDWQGALTQECSGW